jgi:hypothetical protein
LKRKKKVGSQFTAFWWRNIPLGWEVKLYLSLTGEKVVFKLNEDGYLEHNGFSKLPNRLLHLHSVEIIGACGVRDTSDSPIHLFDLSGGRSICQYTIVTPVLDLPIAESLALHYLEELANAGHEVACCYSQVLVT